MIRAVVFDLDGTLVDFMKMKRIACSQAAAAMIDAGLNMREEDAASELLETYFEVGIESENAFEEFLRKKHSLKPEILAAGLNAYIKTKQLFLDPYPSVIKTLLELSKRDIKLGVVTDAPRIKALQRINAMRLQPFFDAVITFDDTGEKKPSKPPFQAIIRKLGLNAEEILFVGDNPIRDIKGAREAGMKTAFAKYGYHPKLGGKKLVKADYELETVKDLLEIVK